MEKYAKLMKGLEVCAGPDCCKDGCPYYGKTTGGMTCRARLLLEAKIAIDNEQALHESAEEYIASLNKDNDNLEAVNKAIGDDLVKLRESVIVIAKERDNLRVERDILRTENAALRHSKTDRPSACDEELMEEVGKLIGQAKYQEGRADALAEIVERCSFGGGGRHE